MSRNAFHPTPVFLATVTVHGPGHFVSGSVATRWLFLLVFLCSTSFCVWQINRTIVNYLNYSVKITKSTDKHDMADFPAITFCPASAYKRLVVGSTPPIYQSAYTTSQPVPNDIGNADTLCSYPDAEPINATYKTTGLPPGFASYQEYFQKTMPDSISSVLSCKIAGTPVNCTNWFFNKFTVMGRCFTFNHLHSVIASYATNDSRGVYGDTVNNIPVKNAGRNGGIQIYMNVNQSQYCIPVDQNTAGFVAFVHDRGSEPFLTGKRLIDLPPGFTTNVAIEFQKVERHTEKWPKQKCYSKYPLHYYPNDKNYTDVAKWSTDCLVWHIYKRCNCYPFYNPPDTNIADNYAIHTLSGVCAADIEKQRCEFELEQAISLGELCNLVVNSRPRPCEESQFRVKVSSTVYPSANIFTSEKRQLQADKDMNIEEFRRNFISATFYFNSFNVEVITVNPGMSWVDLMNQMGGAVGMSLGMSLISLVEISCWLFMTVWKTEWRLFQPTYVPDYRP